MIQMPRFLFFLLYQIYRFFYAIFPRISTLKKIWAHSFGDIKTNKNNRDISHTGYLQVSGAGELTALETTIRSLISQNIFESLIISSGAPDFIEAGKKQLGDISQISWTTEPEDSLFESLLFYITYRPSTVLISDIEPPACQIFVAHFFQLPIIGLNTPLTHINFSHSRTEFYNINLYNFFDKIFTDASQAVISELSLDQSKIEFTPSTKAYNTLKKLESHESRAQRKLSRKKRVLLVGSLWPKEFAYYQDLYKALKQDETLIHLILVPRNFDWQEELIQKTSQLSQSYALWKNTDNISPEIFFKQLEAAIEEKDISLVCKMGLLFDLYKYSSLFYLGGTFDQSVGGHNVLEPAIWEVPIITGPYISSGNKEARILQEQNKLVSVQNAQELITQTKKLLSDKNFYNKLQRESKQWIVSEAHKSERSHQNILSTIKQIQ